MTTDAVGRLVEYFASEREDRLPDVSSGGDRDLLANLLTARPPEPIPPDIAGLLDKLLAAEAKNRQTTHAVDLPRIREQVAGVSGPLAEASVWQGDITTLTVDAIVNAGNDRMLGCFIPAHHCVDNAIHAAAGPELRAECARLMAAQGHREATGQAKVTAGYHLPSRHVIHTVGPIVSDHQPTIDHARLLASSYRSCLDTAHSAGATSIAFCSISTGVFGYPIEQASPIALNTVATWLSEHADIDLHVVFNTFTPYDATAYMNALTTRHL